MNLVIVMVRPIEVVMVLVMLVAMVLEELPSQNCFQKRFRGCVLRLFSKVSKPVLGRSCGYLEAILRHSSEAA